MGRPRVNTLSEQGHGVHAIGGRPTVCHERILGRAVNDGLQCNPSFTVESDRVLQSTVRCQETQSQCGAPMAVKIRDNDSHRGTSCVLVNVTPPPVLKFNICHSL